MLEIVDSVHVTCSLITLRFYNLTIFITGVKPGKSVVKMVLYYVYNLDFIFDSTAPLGPESFFFFVYENSVTFTQDVQYP